MRNDRFEYDENYARLIRTMDVSNKYKEVQPVYIDEHAYNYLHNSNLFGGEIILPSSLTGREKVKIVVHDKCIKILIKEIEKIRGINNE